MSIARTIQKYCLLLTILSSVLSGCASILESAVDAVVDVVVVGAINAAVSCIDNDKPVLEGTLPNPILNQEYNGFIHVGIRNEPYDDSYDYTFALLGDIPPGMRTESAGRKIRLTGTPTSPGVYNFKIRVKVEDGTFGGKDTKGLCFTLDIEDFQWTVQQVEHAPLALQKTNSCSAIQASREHFSQFQHLHY